MIIKSDIWKLDTENLTVENLKTGELTNIFGDHMKYHIHYVEGKNPERFQRLVDEGRILEYLDELDEKVVLAVADQAEKWMNEDKNYRVAVETGNIAEAGRIGNMYTEQAKESVYAAMVYA